MTEAKTLFDHINHIYEVQSPDYFDTLSDGDKKTYSVYMVNRFLSMNPHQLPLINYIQSHSLTPEQHYRVVAGVLPRGKQFNRFIKGAKEEKYEPWLVSLVARHFLVSESEAIEYIEQLYGTNVGELSQIARMYGTSEKFLKKAKLL